MQSNVNRNSANINLLFPNNPVGSYKHFLIVSGVKEVLAKIEVSKSSSIAFVFLPNSDLDMLNPSLHCTRTHLGGEVIGL